VLATDPGAVKDFQAFARTTGHELLESTTEGNVFRFVLKRKAEAAGGRAASVARAPQPACMRVR